MALDFNTIVFFGDSLTDDGNLPEPFRPDPPYVGGRFTNGPVYAELLPGELGTGYDNFAFGGAQATTYGPRDLPLELISLPAQVDLFLARSALEGGVREGTAAAIFIGNNDYLNADRADPLGAAARVPQVLASVDEQVGRLVDAGVEDIVLYTLPDISLTPRGLALTPELRAAADALVEANNLGLKGLAAAYALEGIDVTVVDVNRLTEEVAADRETFGLEILETPLYVPGPGGTLVATGAGAQAGEENVAFFDPIHPTAETHEIVAAFSEATIRADLTDLRGDLDDVVLGLFGDEFVFGGGGEDLIYAWSGSDTVFAGLGDDEIRGGRGDDFLAAGSGDDFVWGGLGDDFIAGNAGNDRLSGGEGDDVIIDSSGGSRIFGDAGDDLILFTADGTGTKEDVVDGGRGDDALRLSVPAETFASTEFQAEFAAFTAGFSSGAAPSFTFDSLDLTVRGVESVQVYVDGAATEAVAGAPAPTPSETVVAQLRDADLWGLV